jgi:hypothetical protein
LQRTNERFVKLEQRLAARTHNELRRYRSGMRRPSGCDRIREELGRRKLAAARPIRSHEVSVAELAERLVSVFFATCPKVAAGETTENCWTAGIGAFAL